MPYPSPSLANICVVQVVGTYGFLLGVWKGDIGSGGMEAGCKDKVTWLLENSILSGGKRMLREYASCRLQLRK